MRIVVTMTGNTVAFEATPDELTEFLKSIVDGDKWLHVTDSVDGNKQHLIQTAQIQSIRIHESN